MSRLGRHLPTGGAAAAEGNGMRSRDPVSFGPQDPRYASIVPAHNRRFQGTPSVISVARSTEQVRRAVGDAVEAGLRVAVRSGGHCLEDFVASPAVRALIDLSQLSDVYYDPEMGAFAIEPGAKLGKVYDTLFREWGVTLPGGTCREVGAGGHFAGGGYGLLSRRYGMVIDHLYAVEVVLVDEAGEATAVVATREAADPHHDLWWAHTGGGGGNFGVVTRYWMRSPAADGTDPARLLPPAPSRMRRRTVSWSWDSMTPEVFARLVSAFGDWAERNSGPDSRGSQIWSALVVPHKSAGQVIFFAGCGDDVPDGEELVAAHADQLVAAVGVPAVFDLTEAVPFLDESNWAGEPTGRAKNKFADLRKGFTQAHIAALYRQFTRTDYTNPGALMSLSTFGGRVNAVAPEATATVARDSILRVYFTAGEWMSADDDARHIGWIREMYRDVFAGTGGVPVPGPVTAGSYINYPDSDLADPRWNSSGVSWETLYYQGNYPRLQAVKRRYDPQDVFRHALSVKPAG
ncbi:FAD-binding oxidoreductase [Amycolatopsis saalfeldensis]|uniref:FAD/FMN-containing dehydrogenase n=1 Tax=Amycolatopsis saalfeldensis TaxID=394193 RepID=A0A1H8YLV1_9PSEU|nr:FAD-binding protein [Amycolatopsis saalfeldensis]SEP52378.1 FAD/FMN-containing dehydrogenase [Amycolatopsis saalfeldensis]